MKGGRNAKNEGKPQTDCVQNRGTFLWNVISENIGE